MGHRRVINERAEPPEITDEDRYFDGYKSGSRRVSTDVNAKTPPNHLGRPFRTHTPLGQVMAERQQRVSQVAGRCNIPIRIMTEYLAGTVKIRGDHLAMLSDYFNVDPEDLQYETEDTVLSFAELVKKKGWGRGNKK